MKLLTRMDVYDGDTLLHLDGDSDTPGDDQLEHDAACAHALMLAHDEFWKRDDLGELDARDAVETIGVRASEFLREWGFDSGEDANETV